MRTAFISVKSFMTSILYFKTKWSLLLELCLLLSCFQVKAQYIQKINRPQYGTISYLIYQEGTCPITIDVIENHFLIYQDSNRKILTISVLQQTAEGTETVPIAGLNYDEDDFYYISPEKRGKISTYYAIDNIFNGLIMTPENSVVRNIRLMVDKRGTAGRKVCLETGHDTIVTRLW